MIFLDSNIIIGYLNGDSTIVTNLRDAKLRSEALFISTLTITETLTLPATKAKTLPRVSAFLDEFIAAQPDKHIAFYAAKLRRTYELSLPDAIILASAAAHGVPFVTRDKQLKKVTEVTHIDW